MKSKLDSIETESIVELTTNTPLNNSDRVKIYSFFLFLILPFIWFGGSAIILLIVLTSIYIMKKNKSFDAIYKAEKLVKWYISLLTIILAFVVSVLVHNEFEYVINESKYLEAVKKFELSQQKEEEKVNSMSGIDRAYYSQAKDFSIALGAEEEQKPERYNFYEPNPYIYIIFTGTLLFILALAPILVKFIMMFFNWLFFKPLKMHREWIVSNGLFASTENEKSIMLATSEVIDKMTNKSLKNADELLKWHELFEKGVITQEEFEVYKTKILG